MEWIKCSERLPVGREEIGYTYDGTKIRSDVGYDRTKHYWFYINSLDYEVEVNVTYWIPMPKPPKDE